jgi:CSLREA domain-containing protein
VRVKAATTGALAAALATLLFATGTAAGKTFRVTVTGDPEPGACTRKRCSLREAILAANKTPARDRIVLPNRKRPYTLALLPDEDSEPETGDLDVLKPLSIVHPGKGFATIDGNGLDRVLGIDRGAATLLRKIVIRNGRTDGDGAGIETASNLRLVRSKVVRNRSGDDGGGIDLDEEATLIMRRSVVSRNVADSSGGGINTSGDGPSLIVGSRITDNRAENDEGGGISLASGDDYRVVRSVVSRNFAGDAGGGIEADASRLVVRRSTIAANTTQAQGGAISSTGASGTVEIESSTISGNESTIHGGGVSLVDARGTLRNSTLAGNRAYNLGGALYALGISSSVRLNAVTIARNVADPDALPVNPPGGGGLFVQDATVSVNNSLIALNRGSQQANDCAGPIKSLGNNLLSVASPGFDRPSDRVAPNPKLGPLKRNGGPTATIALNKGSPAIDKANRRTAPKRDQRGRKRGKRPDIGAYERTPQRRGRKLSRR